MSDVIPMRRVVRDLLGNVRNDLPRPFAMSALGLLDFNAVAQPVADEPQADLVEDEANNADA